MIFVDTGAFIARYLKNDQHHLDAIKIWGQIRNSRICTTSFIISETLTLLGRRIGYIESASIGKNIYTSKYITLEHLSREEELEAIELMEKYSDQKISFADCASFVVIKRSKIKKVFTFDKHFKTLDVEILE